MKNLILFALLFVASFCGAQTTESSFERDTDSTFVETITTTDVQDRVISQTFKYYTTADFAGLAISTASAARIESERKALESAQLARDANQLRLFVRDSLAVNYDSLRADILLKSLVNFSLLREVVGDTTTDLAFTISENVNNPANLLLRSTTGSVRVGIVVPFHFEKFILRNFYENEDVEMTYRLQADRWVGRNSAGALLVLRRR
jgi:hypothetical protein